MNLPFEYDRVAVGEFGGTTPDHDRLRPRPRRHPAGSARSHDVLRRRARATARTRFSSPRRTWSCGTRRPRPTSTASASSRCRRWSFRSRRWTRSMAEIRRVASELVDARKVSGRARRRALDHRRRSSRPSPRQYPGLSVLQIDAHADLRDSFMGTPHNHACAMRRVLEYARDDAGRHPQPVARRSGGGADAADRDLLRLQHAAAIRTGSIASSTRSSETVYITIDCDGFDPAIMPAVGTPEPGGLSWYETLALLRRVIESRHGRRLRPRRAVRRCRATSRRISCARS